MKPLPIDLRLMLSAVLGLFVSPWPLAVAQPTPKTEISGQAPEVTQVRLHFQDRPPYSSRDAKGQPVGLLVAPVQKALKAAGLRASWHLTPAQRQLVLVQQGQQLDCGLGWFRNPERAALGRYSQAIYRDRAYVAMMRKAQSASASNSLEALLADPARTLLVKAGYSYGPAIDAALAQARAQVQSTNAEPLQMARMVAAGRAGWLLTAGEEAEHLLTLPEFAAGPLAIHALAGQPPGSTRHLYCNFAVGEEWLRRLDRALSAEVRP